MNKNIIGKAFVLGNNIDTDQIIPAEHLVYDTSNPEELKYYGKYALSGVPLNESGLPDGDIKFVEEGEYVSNFNIIIAGSNFGCGSSREHAPLSLQVAGVKAIVANSYARIFYRNSVDGGFLIPFECKDKLNHKIRTGDEVEIKLDRNILINKRTSEEFQLESLGDIYDIVEAGGIFEYARKTKMI
jgi:3-isopropylmalate/(R)-2-methylmalate dehydratase small subunit